MRTLARRQGTAHMLGRLYECNFGYFLLYRLTLWSSVQRSNYMISLLRKYKYLPGTIKIQYNQGLSPSCEPWRDGEVRHFWNHLDNFLQHLTFLFSLQRSNYTISLLRNYKYLPGTILIQYNQGLSPTCEPWRDGKVRRNWRHLGNFTTTPDSLILSAEV